jgi:hypothetical protein
MKPIHAIAALAILTSSFAFAASQAASGTTDSDVQQNRCQTEFSVGLVVERFQEILKNASATKSNGDDANLAAHILSRKNDA